MASREGVFSLKKIAFLPSTLESEPMHFYSKNDLLNVSLHHHIMYLKAHLNDKAEFMKNFRENFIKNPNLDCQIFQSSNVRVFYEKKFQYRLPEVAISDLKGLRITAVDGGVGIEEYLGLTLTMIKVAVVNYNFNFRSHPNINKFPPPQRDENYAFFSDVGDKSHDKPRKLANLRRVLAENTLLLQFLQSTASLPDLVILDGSIFPPPKTASSIQQSELHELYQSCISSYLKLYSFCENNGIFLIGSVKDTKTAVLRNILLRAFPSYLGNIEQMDDFYHINYRDLLKNYIDSELVYHALPPHHRTLLFQYSFGLDLKYMYPESIQNYFRHTPVVASYCQISKYDLPLRIELLQPSDENSLKDRFLKILKLILPLSKITPECSLPLPQIEAHLQAHIREEEMALVSQMFENQFRISHFKDQNQPQHCPSNKQPLPNDYINSNFSDTKEWLGTFFKPRHDRLDRIF